MYPLMSDMSLKIDYKTDNGKDDVSDSSDGEDSEMNSNEESDTPMRTYQQTRQKQDHISIKDNTATEETVDPPALSDTGDIVDPPEQEINRHSDPDENSLQSGESSSNKDGCVSTYSTPLAQWKAVREHSVPK